MGVREKEALEKKLVLIGNVPLKSESTNLVSIYFQFKRIEDTLNEILDLMKERKLHKTNKK